MDWIFPYWHFFYPWGIHNKKKFVSNPGIFFCISVLSRPPWSMEQKREMNEISFWFFYIDSKIYLHFKTYTVDNKLLNPSLLGKIFCWFSIWAKDKSNINFCTLISRAFRWLNQMFTPTNSTAEVRWNMILTHLFDW